MIDTNSKIENLHHEILLEFKRRNDILLSICESPIEKLFLLKVIQFYYDKSVYVVSFNYAFDDVDTIPNPKKPAEEILAGPVNFMEKGGGAFLYLKGLLIETPRYFRLYIYPQFPVTIEDVNMRLDFAIIVEGLKNGSIISTKKYCVECDGHDYHSNKIQIAKDNERARRLIKDNWTVLRYSGSEIFNVNKASMEDLEEILLNWIYLAYYNADTNLRT